VWFKTSVGLTFHHLASKVLVLIGDYNISKFHVKVCTEVLANDINLSLKLQFRWPNYCRLFSHHNHS